MNLFNRAVVVLLDLGAIAASLVATLALASPTMREVFGATWPWLARALALLPAHGSDRWTALAVSAAALIAAGVLLVLEVRPKRREVRMLLSSDGKGDVEVVVDSVRRLADHVVERLPEVREVRSLVSHSAKGLRLRCRVAVEPSASVPDVARDIQSHVSAALEHHLGQHVDAVTVLTQITPIGSAPRRRVR